jgi:hypothetical protein
MNYYKNCIIFAQKITNDRTSNGFNPNILHADNGSHIRRGHRCGVMATNAGYSISVMVRNGLGKEAVRQ